jgi:hypothetical protein
MAALRYVCPVEPERCAPAEEAGFCPNHFGVMLEPVRPAAPLAPSGIASTTATTTAGTTASAGKAAPEDGQPAGRGAFRSVPTTRQGPTGAPGGAGGLVRIRILGYPLLVPAEGLDLGRDGEACFGIPGMAELTQVGRFHARLYYQQGRLMVEDNDSLNKTYVDGVAITAPTLLNPGQHLRLGLDVPVEVEFVELDPFGLPR